jgi:hypothetical protein
LRVRLPAIEWLVGKSTTSGPPGVGQVGGVEADVVEERADRALESATRSS